MKNAGDENGAAVAPASWAVVSGAASGLGLAIAKELRHDCHLLLIDADASGLANSQQHLADGVHRIEVVAGDVSQPETWVRARSCLDGAVPQWLVQCAGIAVLGSTVETPIDHWRKALDVNFLGLVLGCQTFADDMARARQGSHHPYCLYCCHRCYSDTWPLCRQQSGGRRHDRNPVQRNR